MTHVGDMEVEKFCGEDQWMKFNSSLNPVKVLLKCKYVGFRRVPLGDRERDRSLADSSPMQPWTSLDRLPDPRHDSGSLKKLGLGFGLPDTRLREPDATQRT